MSDMVLTLRIDAEALKRGVVEVKGKLGELAGKPIDVNSAPAEAKIKSLRDSVAMWGLAIQGAISAFSLVGRELNSVIQPALEAEAGITKVRTAVESTQQAAGYTADELSRMAGEMQKAFAVDDDMIMNDLTAPLLTFTKVTGDAFARAQEAALDLSVIMGGDLKGAALQLGKALNDPAQGLTALRRSGVSFTDDQIELIKGLWEAGEAAQAQAIILDELNRQFGGQAAAYAESYAGKINALKLAWGDMAQAIGELLLPVLSGLAKMLTPLVQWFTEISGLMKAVITVLAAMTVAWMRASFAQVAYTTVTGGLTAALAAAKAAMEAMTASLNPVTLVLTGVTVIVGSLAMGLKKAKSASEELTKEQDASRQEAMKQKASFEMLSDTYMRLRSNTNRTVQEQNMLAYTISQMKALAPEHLRNLDMEKGKYEDISRALANVRGELEAKINLSAQNAVLERASEALAKMREVQLYLRSGEADRALMRMFNPDVMIGARDAIWAAGGDINAAIRGIENAINNITARSSSIISRFPTVAPPAGGGGGGGASSGAGSIAAEVDERAKAFAELETMLTEYHKTEQRKLNEHADSMVSTIKEWYDQWVTDEQIAQGNLTDIQREKYYERQQLIGMANRWHQDETGKLALQNEATLRASEEARTAKLASYYEAVKWLDGGYYDWKVRQIKRETYQLNLGAEQGARLIQMRIDELDRERDAQTAVADGLTAIRARYVAWKAEMADSAEMGVRTWQTQLEGLLAFKAELETLEQTDAVAAMIRQLQGEIDIAQMNAGKKKSWFWSGLLGFDPDNEADQRKIQAYKDTYNSLANSMQGITTGLLGMNEQRKTAELARIDEVAAREQWTTEQTTAAREAAMKRYEAEEKKLKRIQKNMSIASAVMNVAEGATKALAMGPIIGPIMAAVLTAMGAVQIGIIKAQKFATGGLFRGAGTGTSDSNLAYISDGEYIVNAAATRRNMALLDAVNYGTAPVRVGSDALVKELIRKVEILNLNLVKKDMRVEVHNHADVQSTIRTQDHVRPNMERLGYVPGLS